MAEFTSAQILTAIEAVLETGQSYSLGRRTVTHANISELREMLKEAQLKESRTGGKGILMDDFSHSTDGFDREFDD